MGRRVVSTVYVSHPETGEHVRVLAGDEAPDWVEAAATNPKVWEAETDAPADPGAEPGLGQEPAADDYAGPADAPAAAPDEAPDEATGRDYATWTVVDLKAEIAARNDGRDDAEKIPTDGNKADLVAALEADDEDTAAVTE